MAHLHRNVVVVRGSGPQRRREEDIGKVDAILRAINVPDVNAAGTFEYLAHMAATAISLIPVSPPGRHQNNLFI